MNYTVFQPRQIVPPGTDAVALDAVKEHLRITHDAEDPLLRTYTAAATRVVEAYLRRQLITATYEWSVYRFPPDGAIVLPLSPVQSVEWVEYLDTLGADQTLDTSVYAVRLDCEPALLVRRKEECWPSTRLDPVADVTMQIVVGYGDVPADVPADIRLAIMELTGRYYRDREAGGELTPAIRSLLHDRVFEFV